MSVAWKQIGGEAAVVAYFTFIGSQMPRVITKIAVNPSLGAISGAIFGLLTISPGRKDVFWVANVLILNSLITIPFACQYHAVDTAIKAACGLTALHITHFIALSMLSSVVFRKP